MSLVSFITRRISKRPVEQERLIQILNREIVPALNDLISAANARVFATTFGDGAATSFVIEHGLASRNLLALVRNSSTDLVVAPLSIAFSTDDEVTIVMASAPAAGELTLVVMK